MTTRRARLSKRDWIDAGLAMVGERGVDGVAVEALARRVGATKGSFYWHFTDLAAFLRALLADWRERETEQVIASIEALPEVDRLPALLRQSATPGGGATTLAIMAAAGHPEVGPVVHQVQQQRIGYLQRLFRDRGLPGPAAEARAHISYAAYLGNLLMAEGSSRRGGQAMEGYLAELLIMLDS